ncbi:hypothetical protein SD208_11330 [Ochrobactrum sp. BD67]
MMLQDFENEQDLSSHYIHSVLRERIVEHVFIGDTLRRLWQLGITDVEVMRSEFDAGGYDLVMSRGNVIRHIQFKTMGVEATTKETTISMKLLEKPSGCVIWIVVTRDLQLVSYLWLGGLPGESIADFSNFTIAKHVKANAKGIKREGPNHRKISSKKFQKLSNIDQVIEKLFGSLKG